MMGSRIDHPSCQRYGIPIYGSSWVPLDVTRSTSQDSEKDGDSGYIVFAGGGGEGHSGIPNSLLLAQFDFSSSSLSISPVATLGTGDDLPYRMAVHPSGEGLVCSFLKSCRSFEWGKAQSSEDHCISLKSSENILTQLEDVGLQLALAFDAKGCLLATGGEDGKLRVFRWPSMERILYDDQAYTNIKNLHLSSDGKFLVSVGNQGLCRVWDVTLAEVATTLPRKNNEMFGFGRFVRIDGIEVLYTITVQEKGGSIIAWNTNTWKRMFSKLVSDICAFSASDDGTLLAVGTTQGDILVIKSSTLQVQMKIKKAHLGLVTTLAFSHDTRALVSASFDSSTRVTMIHERRNGGFDYWIIVLVAVIAVIIYLAKTQGILSSPFCLYRHCVYLRKQIK